MVKRSNLNCVQVKIHHSFVLKAIPFRDQHRLTVRTNITLVDFSLSVRKRFTNCACPKYIDCLFAHHQ